MSTNSEKPNTEAASNSTPAPAKKSRFRPTFRSPRIPRETKLGLGIIFSLVCVFGYVLYSRLTRPTNLDPEQYVAQGESLLAPSVTNGQPTNLPVQPAGHSPTILPGNAPQNAMPLSNPANNHAASSQYSTPAGGAAQPSWSPNSTPVATTGSDPFMNRGGSTSANSGNPAPSYSASGFGANSTGNNTTTGIAKQPGVTGYGASDTTDVAAGPNNSFMPPADRATSGSTTMSVATQPEHATTNDPAHSVTTGSVAAGGATATSPVDAFNKSATDSLHKLRQEGQDLVNSGTNAQQNLGKAADNANQLLGQAQQQFGQYTNSAGTNANSLLNQAKDASTQYGADLKASATQYGADLKTAAQNQASQYANQLRNNANTMVNDASNQLNSGTSSVMTKAGESTSNLMNSATTAMNGGQPLTPLPATNSAVSTTPSSSGYSMPAATPRTLEQPQPLSAQPLNAQPLSASNQPTPYPTAMQAEQPIRIQPESSNFATQPTAASQPAMATQPAPIYGTSANVATAPSNYGASANAATAPNYGTAPATQNYGTNPAYGGATSTPATSQTPLQFNTPTMPAAQPATPVYGGATRTNFEQPARAASATRGVQQYTVTGQDSYYSVAEKMYGNGAFNKALYEYNRRNNPAADRLQVGGAMLIPDLATLQAQFPDLVPSTAAASTATSTTELQVPR